MLTLDIYGWLDAPAWEAQKHPRGKPHNAGQFTSKGATSSARKVATGGARSAAKAATTTATVGQQRHAAANPARQSVAQRVGGATNVVGNRRAVDFAPTTNAAAFHNSITSAKAASQAIGASVHVYTPEEYATMRLFLTTDHTAGFALKGDDIVSVFKHPDSPHQNVARAALEMAVANGGRRLDCFDTVLPHFYSNNHFRAVARTAFNDEYAPEGWDYRAMQAFNNGRPDVVFMVFDPTYSRLYQRGEGRLMPDYDSAQALQQHVVARLVPQPKASKAARVANLLQGVNSGRRNYVIAAPS